MIRLQKFIAQAGITSRRHAEDLIVDGLIKVNGEVVDKLGTVIDEENDQVEYRGKLLKPESNKIYIALNKPVGYVSTAATGQGKSILSLVKASERLFPVGRLDKDSSGLIILTNDGEFANLATHPRYGHEKEYFVVIDHQLKPEAINRMERGLTLDGKKLQPTKILSVSKDSFRIVLKEGVNRQIRRMLGRLGYTVIRLKRVRVGKLELGNLQEGQWKRINKNDL